MILKPQIGFQTKALECSADVAIIGGAAGCGKTWTSVVDPLRWIHLQNFHAVIFRRTFQQLKGGDSIWEESLAIYPAFGGRPNFSDYIWRFPSGATIKFNHLQHDKNKLDHQGMSYGVIIFEELTHFTEEQFWYLLSRNRSKSHMRPYLRATCNPDAESFVARLVDWYIDDNGFTRPERSGQLRYFVRDGEELIWADTPDELMHHCDADNPNDKPLSFTYIQGSLDDNQILLDTDPSYRSKLKQLQLVERERLLDSNWKAVPSSGKFYKREYFDIATVRPDNIIRSIRFWDKAATEATGSNDPSWTVGILVHMLADGRLYVEDVCRFRGTPGKVDRYMLRIAKQDTTAIPVGFFQDPGQAGVVDKEHVQRLLTEYQTMAYKVGRSKIAMASPVSAVAEQHGIVLQKADWNSTFLNELCPFPKPGAHDDQVDALSGAYQFLKQQAFAVA